MCFSHYFLGCILVLSNISLITPDMEKKSALVFLCGNRYFGIESSMVVEVLFQHYVVKQAHLKAPFFAVGRIDGEKIPIICSGQRLGLNKAAKACLGNVVLLKVDKGMEKQLVGLMVEAVEGTVHYTDNELTVADQMSFGGMVDGFITCDGLDVNIIDLGALLGVDSCRQHEIHESSCVA
jgi:chemotaxis signal transduction protein